VTAQERVDARYKALTNTQYDAAHGYATLDDLRAAEERYHEALSERDAEAVAR
jgi:hypothetical protein